MRKPSPSRASTLVTRHAHLLEEQLAVAVLVVVAEHGEVAHDGDARGVHGHEHHRLAVVDVGLRVGLTHEHEDLAARVERARWSTTCGR